MVTFSKRNIREGLREAAKILIGKIERTTHNGSADTESFCDVLSKISDALKHYDHEILDETEAEAEIITEIMTADDNNLNINLAIARVKGRPDKKTIERLTPQTTRTITHKETEVRNDNAVDQSLTTNNSENCTHTSVGVCLISTCQNDAISNNGKDLRKKPCVFCSEIHAPWTCVNVTNVKKRRDIIKEKRLCYNCLGTHKIAHCKSEKTCKNCGKRHNTSICFAGGRTLRERKEDDTVNTSNPIRKSKSDLATYRVPQGVTRIENENDTKKKAIVRTTTSPNIIKVNTGQTSDTPIDDFYGKLRSEQSGTGKCHMCYQYRYNDRATSYRQ